MKLTVAAPGRWRTGLGLSSRRRPAHWDELVDPSGRLPAALEAAGRRVAPHGLAEFDKRGDAGQRLIQANGITYNVYGDPQGKERPWRMDPAPARHRGERSGRGSSARSVSAPRCSMPCWRSLRLRSACCATTAPARAAVRQPELPAAVRTASCRRGGVFLQNYAVDLARAPNGAWWVIADRDAGALGPRLCAREPPRQRAHAADAARPVPCRAR